jgi:Kef-type K+ transport system membrane component KefB
VNETLVIETLTLIGAAAFSIALLARIGLPAVLGYLFAGIVIGPLGFGLVAASEGARFLAELETHRFVENTCAQPIRWPARAALRGRA